MKTNLLVIIMFLGVLSAFAQSPLPNFGFENWTMFNGREVPVNWLVNDTTTSKTSDRYSGNYAIKIQNIITTNDTMKGRLISLTPDSSEGLSPAFPVNVKHTTFNGYYKYSPLNGDSAQIIVFMFKHGYVNPQSYNLLGGGWKNYGLSNVYIPFTFNISYFDSTGNIVPDSTGVSIFAFKDVNFTTGGHDVGVLGNSVLFLDNLSFDGFITGINNIPDMIKDVNIYPNPASDKLTIDLQLSENDYNINLYDLSGKLIKAIANEKLIGETQLSVNIIDIPQGNYILMISTNDGYYSKKVSIVK